MRLFILEKRLRRRRAVTLVEMMMAMLTTTIAVAAILSAYIYGMRMTQFIKPKLLASDDARRIVSLLTDEIRAATDIKLGNGNANSFTDAPIATLQLGNALLIYPGTNTNAFVRYYVDSSEKRLKRATNGSTSPRTIADGVTNKMPFTYEDTSGKVLSNRSAMIIVGMNLQFQQSVVGQNTNSAGYYDYYQLSTKVTKRTRSL